MTREEALLSLLVLDVIQANDGRQMTTNEIADALGRADGYQLTDAGAEVLERVITRLAAEGVIQSAGNVEDN